VQECGNAAGSRADGEPGVLERAQSEFGGPVEGRFLHVASGENLRAVPVENGFNAADLRVFLRRRVWRRDIAEAERILASDSTLIPNAEVAARFGLTPDSRPL
jgi:hypothetical protein